MRRKESNLEALSPRFPRSVSNITQTMATRLEDGTSAIHEKDREMFENNNMTHVFFFHKRSISATAG